MDQKILSCTISRRGTSSSCSSLVSFERNIRKSSSCWKSWRLSRKGWKHDSLQPHAPSTLRRRINGKETGLKAAFFSLGPLAIAGFLRGLPGTTFGTVGGSSSLRAKTSCIYLKGTSRDSQGEPQEKNIQKTNGGMPQDTLTLEIQRCFRFQIFGIKVRIIHT